MGRLFRSQLLAVVLGISLPFSVIHAQGIGTGVGVAFQWLRGTVTTSLIFAVDWEGGIAGLSSTLTVSGGQTGTLRYRYEGADAGASDWPGSTGQNLSLQSGTGSVAVGQGTPLPNTTDQAVEFAGDGTTGGGDYYLADAVNTSSNHRTSFAMELVYRVPVSASFTHVITEHENGAQAGLYLEHTGSFNQMRFVYFDGSGNSRATIAGFNEASYVHVLAFGDGFESTVSNQWDVIVNGAAQSVSADGNLNTAIDDITPAGKLSIGADDAGERSSNAHVVYAAQWTFDPSSSIGSDANKLAIAKERFAKLTGTWADTGSVGPSTATRSSSAYLTKYNATSSAHELYLVGDNWIRTGRYNDGSESRWNVQVEDSAENKALYSNDYATGWTKIDAGDTLGTGVAAPDPTATSQALVADATDGQHGYTQAITLTAASWAISVFAKPGNQDFLYLSDDTVANGNCYFNVNTCAVTTTGAAATCYAEDNYSNGFCRAILVVTGTAASHTIRVASATADGDDTFAGDGATSNTHTWNKQVELGSYPTTPIGTTSAAVTRAAGTLRYTMSSSYDGPFTVTMGHTWPDIAVNSGFDTILRVGDLSEGLELFSFYSDGGGNIRFGFRPGGNNNDINTSVKYGTTWTDYRIIGAADDGRLYKAGASIGTPDTDTSGVGYAGFDYVDVGQQGGSSYMGGYVGPIEVYNAKVEP